MFDIISNVISNIVDGIWIGLGAGLVWLGGVLVASIMRSLGVAGGSGFKLASRFAIGWWRYTQGDARDVVNVTLNTTRGGVLSIDTIVGDRKLLEVWPNDFQVRKILSSAKRCTLDCPVVMFVNGDSKRIDAYRAVYDTITSMIAERCTNDGSIDLALGKQMIAHKFVIGLTYEPIQDGRLRHLRVMMILEDEIDDILDESRVIHFARPQHATRLNTMREIARIWRATPEKLGYVNVWRRDNF